MIKAAERLFREKAADKPTVLLMIDRNELEDQMLKNLSALGLGNLEHASSIARLNQLLKDDYRGIIVTMIHKFRDMPADLNTRSNIYVLIDEAHRTTGGDLGNFLMAGLPNATFLGFTGTPVDKTAYGKGTFKTFGCEDDKGYLHKYSIAESIEDGTTLPLYYQLAPNEMLVPHETLDAEFLSLAEAEGVADIEELNKILERAVNLKNFLKGKERIEKVAQFAETLIQGQCYHICQHLNNDASQTASALKKAIASGEITLEHAKMLEQLLSDRPELNPLNTTDINELESCDVIVVATSTEEADLIQPGQLKTGAIVCCTSVPSNLSDKFGNQDDVLAFDGGFHFDNKRGYRHPLLRLVRPNLLLGRYIHRPSPDVYKIYLLL